MKISREWLQTYFNDPLPEAAVLADALTFHVFEIDGIENDVLDVKVTANRGHDCLSHRGIAKEVSAILQLPMKNDPLRQPLTLEPKTDVVEVIIDEPTLCNRYVAGYMRGVKVGPSPEWLQKRLASIGQRSINNIVDATNYVMFGLGQPLHAFDAQTILSEDGISRGILVRKARAGEDMPALDDKDYTFTDSMLLITDMTDAHGGGAIGIAGVKGGKTSGVTEATTDIIIESANFDGVSVRKTAQALKLRTDASARFEQSISAEYAGYGMKAVVELIREIAGGEVVGFVDTYPIVPEKKTVSVTLAHINAVLGTQLKAEDVESAFTRLDLAHAQQGDTFEIHVPFERLDLAVPEDLIEEAGRIMGYDKVPAVELQPLSESPAINQKLAAREKVRELLSGEGFSEVFTSVFAEKGERIVANKADGVKPYLRAELLTGLRDALDRNVRNKDLLGEQQIKLFEIGMVWRGGEEFEMLGIAVEKMKKAKSASEYASSLAYALGAGSVAEVPEEVIEIPLASLTSALPASATYEELSSTSTERYLPFSKYPCIVRDVAMWTPSGTAEDAIREVITGSAGELLVRLDSFDRFEKEGRVSYAFRLVFQSFDKTLTDGDAHERMESVYAALKNAGFEIR